MKDPKAFAEMSTWVAHLGLPGEGTKKEHENFQGFYWHSLIKGKKYKSIL